MTRSLGSVCMLLEYGLDDYGSWYSMYGIGAWTRRPRLLVVYVLYWGTE